MRRFLAAAVAVLLIGPAYAASGAQEITPGDVAAARDRANAVAAELGDVTAEYEAAVVKRIGIEDNLNAVAAELSVAERTLANLREEAKTITRSLYVEAGNSGVADMLDTGSINELGIREEYLNRLSESSSSLLARYQALASAQTDQQLAFADLEAEQAEIVADLDALSASILERLSSADAEYRSTAAAYEAQEEERRRREEAERLRREEEERLRLATSTTIAATTTTLPDGVTTTTIEGATTTSTTPPATTTPPTTAAPPPPSSDKACPVNGAHSYIDSWGAPRSGGRSHQGVDMMAARGTPLVAIESGSISKLGNSSSLGGITVWIKGKTGHSYYYAHLDSWASGVYSGMPVTAGQLIGYVGSTGNASYGAPHLHFEYHPGGGSAVNPTPLMDSLCR